MISLNGVTLSEDLLWENEFDNPAISQNTQRTILGTQIIQLMPIVSGRIIQLVAVSSGNTYQGYFTKTQVEAFKVLEQNASIVTFIYEAVSINVIVQAGGVQVAPLIPRPNQAGTDLYTGTLILIEV